MKKDAAALRETARECLNILSFNLDSNKQNGE